MGDRIQYAAGALIAVALVTLVDGWHPVDAAVAIATCFAFGPAIERCLIDLIARLRP